MELYKNNNNILRKKVTYQAELHIILVVIRIVLYRCYVQNIVLLIKDMLMDNGSLYAEIAQDLLNKELEKNEEMEQRMERKRADQLSSFQEKLNKRKEERLRKLRERQEIEKATVNSIFMN